MRVENWCDCLTNWLPTLMKKPMECSAIEHDAALNDNSVLPPLVKADLSPQSEPQSL